MKALKCLKTSTIRPFPHPPKVLLPFFTSPSSTTAPPPKMATNRENARPKNSSDKHC